MLMAVPAEQMADRAATWGESDAAVRAVVGLLASATPGTTLKCGRHRGGQDPQQLADHLAAMKLDAIAQAVETATLDQWMASAPAGLTELQRYVELRRQIEARSAPA